MVTNINIYFNKFINYLKFLNSSNRLLRFARKEVSKHKIYKKIPQIKLRDKNYKMNNLFSDDEFKCFFCCRCFYFHQI